MYCNAGTTTMNKFGFMDKLNVWVNPNVLDNILIFHELKQHYLIKYNTSSTKGTFVVRTNQGNIVLKKHNWPYIGIATASKAFCLITTIRANFDGHIKRKIVQKRPGKH